MQKLTKAFLALSLLVLGSAVHAQNLKGSRASMERQHQFAKLNDYTFLKTSSEVAPLVAAGRVEKVVPNRHFDLHAVSHPYALPTVRKFIERLAALYYQECGEKLVVTSLMRPMDRQPANAAKDSVHPTGMAVDLRIPGKGKCRSWLENSLLALEAAEVLDVTREHNPPHYHVAVFPDVYALYLEAEGGSTLAEYVVRPGDSLSVIARRTGTTIAQLRLANGLRGDLINVGQKLQIPVAGGSTSNSSEPRTLAVVATETLDVPDEIEHRVQRGDTLWRIARRYGTTVNLIKAQNGLRSDALQVGKVLKVVRSGSL